MRTALSCFLEDPIPHVGIAIYDIDPGVRPYGIVNGEPMELEMVKDKAGRPTSRVITPLEDMSDLESAAWRLLVHVARVQRVLQMKTAYGPLSDDEKFVLERDGFRIRVCEPEYMARHAVKDGKHGLMVYNPERVELLAEPS